MDIRFYILSILFIAMLCAFKVGQFANIEFEFHLKSLPRELIDNIQVIEQTVLNFLALLAFLPSIHFLFYPK